VLASVVEGESAMKKTFMIAVLAVMLVPHYTDCQTRFGIGVRGGIVADYDNPEFSLPHKLDIDQLTVVGGHVQFGGFPIFTLELAVESRTRTEEMTFLGAKTSAEVKDLMIAANLKYLFRIPVITPYIGGGIASHNLNYEYNAAVEWLNPEGAIHIPDDGSRFGVHGIAGVALGFAASPIELFIEGRIGRIEGDEESAKYKAVYGGVTLRLL